MMVAHFQVVLGGIVSDESNFGASDHINMKDGQPVGGMREFTDGSRIFTCNVWVVVCLFFLTTSSYTFCGSHAWVHSLSNTQALKTNIPTCEKARLHTGTNQTQTLSPFACFARVRRRNPCITNRLI